MSTIKFISTTKAAAPGGHYSQAVRYGDLVFVSGQLPVRPDGTHTAQSDFESQAKQVLNNVVAVLAGAGASPRDVLKVTVYIAGIEHWPAFNRLYAEVFGDHRPARSVVPVPELHYGYLVEIDAIAASVNSSD